MVPLFGFVVRVQSIIALRFIEFWWKIPSTVLLSHSTVCSKYIESWDIIIRSLDNRHFTSATVPVLICPATSISSPPYCTSKKREEKKMTVLVVLSKKLCRSAVTGARCFSNVGFVGLGNMGGHMARNLMKKGFKLTVFDINKAAVTKLVEAGAKGAPSATELAKEVEVIITMLPTNQHVLDVYNKENGLLSTAKKNTLLIDSSTVDPSVSQAVAKDAENAQVAFIDGPVSGGVNAARDATLTFMVGGSAKNFELAKPVLQAMGAKTVHCGDIGMGEAAKICNNMLLAISMIGTSEAFNLGQKLGLDAKVLADIINSSTGRCWSSQLYNPVPGLMEDVPSSKGYEGGFGTALVAKDLGLAQAAGVRTESPIPLGSLAHQIYRTMMVSGLGMKDFSVVYQFLKGNK